MFPSSSTTFFHCFLLLPLGKAEHRGFFFGITQTGVEVPKNCHVPGLSLKPSAPLAAPPAHWRPAPAAPAAPAAAERKHPLPTSAGKGCPAKQTLAKHEFVGHPAGCGRMAVAGTSQTASAHNPIASMVVAGDGEKEEQDEFACGCSVIDPCAETG